MKIIPTDVIVRQIAARAEMARIAEVVGNGAENYAPPPDEDLLTDAEIDHAFGVGVAYRNARLGRLARRST